MFEYSEKSVPKSRDNISDAKSIIAIMQNR